jgi:uncharacterized protein (TIGR01777 family)
MPDFVFRTHLKYPVADVFAWHMRPGAFERLIPPWERVTIESCKGTPETGGRVAFRVRRGPTEIRIEVLHTDFERNRFFRAEQIRGPFTRWVHTHRFEAGNEGGCTVEDHVDWEVPMGTAGRLLRGSSVEVELRRLFRFRHRRLRHDLDRIARNRNGAPLRVAVSGSRGLIGQSLCDVLTTGGHSVVRLVRNRNEQTSGDTSGNVSWDPIEGIIEEERLEGLDAVVHLAGEPLLGLRWTEEKKRRIWASRVEGTEHLSHALACLRRPPSVLVSASAVGFYGNRGDESLSESANPGSGFLAELCQAWEAATRPAARMGIRVAHLRTGLVLTPAGGALGMMLPSFKIGIGGRIGSGRQYVSWIDHDDLLGMISHVIHTPSIRGAVNATAPYPVPNSTFTGTLGRVLRRPTLIPIPGLAVQALFGEMGKEMLLQGQRIQPAVAETSGFEFEHPGLEASLRYQLGREVQFPGGPESS